MEYILFTITEWFLARWLVENYVRKQHRRGNDVMVVQFFFLLRARLSEKRNENGRLWSSFLIKNTIHCADSILSACHSVMSVCHSIMSACHSIMSFNYNNYMPSCYSITIFHNACLSFNYVRLSFNYVFLSFDFVRLLFNYVCLIFN